MKGTFYFILNCSLFLCFGLLHYSYAQLPAKFQHYSTEEGLSHDVITTMFKDREGYMWFGTWYGLNRFDGNHFVAFKAIAGDSSEILSNRIDQITEDSYQQLWVKAYDGRIYRFDKAKETFKSLAALLKIGKDLRFDRILSADGKSLWIGSAGREILYIPDVRAQPVKYLWFKSAATSSTSMTLQQTRFFKKDRVGNVWIGGNGGIFQLNQNQQGEYEINRKNSEINADVTACETDYNNVYYGTSQGMVHVFNLKTAKKKSVYLKHLKINGLKPSRNGRYLYITTAEGKLLCLDVQMFNIKEWSAPTKEPLYSIFEDREQNLWIEPDKRGVFRFNAKTSKFEFYTQITDSKNINGGNHFKVFEDVNGRVWCVLRDGGFGYYDASNHKFQYFYNKPGGKDHRISNLVTIAFYDRTGVMWLHTDEHGLEKIIFQSPVFTQNLVNEEALFQSDNEIRAVCSDRKNRLWVCAKSGRIFLIEHGIKKNAPFLNPFPASNNAAYKIFEDHKGVIWIGTKASGLYKATPVDKTAQQYRLTHFTYQPNDPHSLSSNEIYAIAEDSQNRLWIGTFDKGLNLLEEKEGVVSFRRITTEAYGYPNNFIKIRNILPDAGGRLWLGTTNGLVLMNSFKAGYQFKTFVKEPGNRRSLGSNDVLFIYKDRKNRKWLATAGGGLNLVIENHKKDKITFKHYTAKQGLASDFVLSCIADDQHHIWLATKSSLSRFDPEKEVFKNFNSFDGLPKAAFSESTCAKTAEGSLVFGTNRGYLFFDPKAIKPHPIEANIVFTNLQVNNQDVTRSSHPQILNNNINFTDGIVLKHNQNVVSVNYALLDYRVDHDLLFSYRLQGFDDKWHNNKGELRATYTNLPAGKYSLEIKCIDPARYIKNPYRKLTITVLPAPWATWWAYLGYSLIIIAIIWWLWKNFKTTLQLKHKIALEHELTELKLNFVSNISHELRTPLTLIVNPIDHLIESQSPNSLDYHYLNIVRRNANRMMRFVNQLIDFRKIQRGKSALHLSRIELPGFINEIAAHFEDVQREKRIEFNITYDIEEVVLYADQDKIETVIYNLLSNAFKFSPEGSSVTAKIMKLDESVCVTISDQGPGVKAADLTNIFELYHTSDAQSSSGPKGVGIGLALTKELIELHQGNIIAENLPDAGLAVSFTIPLVQAEQQEVPEMSAATFSVEPKHDMYSTVVEQPLLLLVEDNNDMREFLRIQLRKTYRVETASDGIEGLEKAQKLFPDLILSDVMMPGMDGIELVKTLKNQSSTSHIPVVLMSARSAIEHQVAGLTYGADFYLPKPFKNELLEAALSNLLAQRKRLFANIGSAKKIVSLNVRDIVVTARDEEFIKRVIDIIEENMENPNFDIDAVSDKLNMGRASFYKKFKSLTQIPPVEFVRDVRLHRAKQLLEAGKGNVGEVAYMVGFANAKYFSTCFKAKYNISPSEISKRISSVTKNKILGAH